MKPRKETLLLLLLLATFLIEEALGFDGSVSSPRQIKFQKQLLALNFSEYKRGPLSLQYVGDGGTGNGDGGGLKEELGSRRKMGLDLPGKNFTRRCDECERPNSSCSLAWMCICDASKCKHEILPNGGSVNILGPIISFSLLSLVVVRLGMIDF